MPDIKATIARLREEMTKTTEGPWESQCAIVVRGDGTRLTEPSRDMDAIFIADAHDSLPALLDALEEAMRKAEELKKELEIADRRWKTAEAHHRYQHETEDGCNSHTQLSNEAIK